MDTKTTEVLTLKMRNGAQGMGKPVTVRACVVTFPSGFRVAWVSRRVYRSKIQGNVLISSIATDGTLIIPDLM